MAATTPELVFRTPVAIETGPTDEQVAAVATGMGLAGGSHTLAMNLVRSLYTMFISTDCTMLECNPVAETPDGQGVCLCMRTSLYVPVRLCMCFVRDCAYVCLCVYLQLSVNMCVLFVRVCVHGMRVSACAPWAMPYVARGVQ